MKPRDFAFGWYKIHVDIHKGSIVRGHQATVGCQELEIYSSFACRVFGTRDNID